MATLTPAVAPALSVQDQIKAVRSVQLEYAGKVAAVCSAYRTTGKPLDVVSLAQAGEIVACLDVAITALQGSVGA